MCMKLKLTKLEMSYTNTLVFSKLNKFKQYVFYCNKQDSEKDYDALVDMANKIRLLGFETHNPVYSCDSEPYCTIQFRPWVGSAKPPLFAKGATYDVSYDVRKVERHGKVYINLHIASWKFVAEAPEIDLGEVVKL